jgi:phage terminase small subunit
MYAALTHRQERFVSEFLKDQNASAAAARAGYTATNMAQQGSELMNNPAIRERVRLEMQGLLAELRASALELMKQRMRAAFFDAGKLFGSGWEPLPLEELDQETRAALEVSTVMRKSGPVVRVRQPDRSRALRALEKVHERLDRLNEQYYAQLERDGLAPTLEEIEAMDQSPAAADEISQKPMVFSGCDKEAQIAWPQISEKPMVLSGCGDQTQIAQPQISAKTQILSGAPPGQPAECARGGQAWTRRRAKKRPKVAARKREAEAAEALAA